MKRLAPAIAALAAVALPLIALGHHSTANFDMQKHITFKGTVQHTNFTNPHSLIEMDVVDKAGKVSHYKVASVPRVTMLRTGWAMTDVNVGDVVNVTANPDRKDPTYWFLESITFVNGKTWNRSVVF